MALMIHEGAADRKGGQHIDIDAITRWAQRSGIVSDDDALAAPVGPDHGFEELEDPSRLSGTDPPTAPISK